VCVCVCVCVRVRVRVRVRVYESAFVCARDKIKNKNRLPLIWRAEA
jgi:hypothetical protein